MLNYTELRKEFKGHRHVLGLNQYNTTDKQLYSALVMGACFILAMVILICGDVAHAENTGNPGKNYTNEAIVRAIYLAEGGKNAQYPYGIRSVQCSSKSECRKICTNTVRNNRKRWQRETSSVSFIKFLASRYCPINASNDQAGVNQFWLKNVMYFLRKEVV